MSPSLPVITGKEAFKALKKIGYEVNRQRGSHVRLAFAGGGRPPITVPVHAGKALGWDLLHAILRDSGLTVEQFRALL